MEFKWHTSDLVLRVGSVGKFKGEGHGWQKWREGEVEEGGEG